MHNGFHVKGLREHAGAESLDSTYLALVVSVDDPDKLARVQIRLLNYDGASGQDAAVWARVALPFAGDKRGVFMLPDVGDEVLVTFVNGDSRFPVVVGGLWNGGTTIPETLGGDRVDRWTITGKAGTRIAIEEKTGGQPTIVLTTPGGVVAKFSDEGGGKILLSIPGGNQITMDSSGVSVQTSAKVSVQATQTEVNSGQVTVNAGVSKFSGLLQCDILQANTVIATTYTPGAGNVW
jgi:uncharacterized protein involved in type VI secretion and phage assembly